MINRDFLSVKQNRIFLKEKQFSFPQVKFSKNNKKLSKIFDLSKISLSKSKIL